MQNSRTRCQNCRAIFLGRSADVFKTGRITGWLILAAVAYCLLQASGLLPDGAKEAEV
jgi:hypothetical protein